MFNPENPPELTASRWYNGEKTTLASLRGKVIVVAAFQILCPGSVKHGLPQAMRLRRAFAPNEVAIVGLHMAFEHFDKQSPDKVADFLTQNGIDFPVAYDKSDGDALPAMMQAYALQGTPAILMFDRQGRVRRHYLGAVDDMRIGAEVMALLMEDKDSPREVSIDIERRIAAALVDPEEQHHHDGGCCGHDHGYDHSHSPSPSHGHEHHDHARDGGCCGGHEHLSVKSSGEEAGCGDAGSGCKS